LVNILEEEPIIEQPKKKNHLHHLHQKRKKKEVIQNVVPSQKSSKD
jgi:hypothetical protein